MSRLPQPGHDDGTWGDILNDFLSQEHNADGSLKIRSDGTLSGSVADGSITAAKLDSTVNSYLADAQAAVQSVNGKTGQAVSLKLDDLSGVTTTGISDGQVLSRSGPNWIPGKVDNVIDVKRDYGAKGDGTTDDTTAIQNAIATAAAAGRGLVFLPAGKYLINSTLSVTHKYVYLVGAGRFATTIVPSPGFSGNTPMISITADYCGVRDMAIAFGSASSASNPQGNAIQVTGARYAELQSLDFSGVNGYAIEVAASSTVAPFGAMMSKIHVLHCAGGIHLISNNSSSNGYGMQAWITDVNLEICDSLDNLLIEDCNDVLVENINGAAAQGTAFNSTIHVKGKVSSVYISNPDVGVYPGPASAPTVLIEAGVNGVPSNIQLVGGVVQAGAPNLQISDGTAVKCLGTTIKSANTHGANVTGSSGPISFDDCTFQANNQQNGTNYDLQISMPSNFAYIRNCTFASPVAQGTAGSVSNPVNDTTHKGYFFSTAFAGTGNTPSTVFASSGTPQIVRNCPGYNPRGGITAPTITASPFTTNSSQNDITLVFTSATTNVTALKLNGTSIGVPVQGAAYRVPARASIEVDYTSTAPTWVWIAD